MPTIHRDLLSVTPEVADALRDGRPVVALESTLISHGFDYPFNVEVATASELAVRESGAVPATVAIHGGLLLVGLEGDQLHALGTAPKGAVRKVARPTLAAALATGGWGATTVSATMLAANAVGIEVFATGGIGGVHLGALGGERPTFDISADLEELSKTPVTVVCAGPKAILDVGLTLEYLETHGVPVVAIGTDEVPGFWARGSGFRAPSFVRDVAGAAEVMRAHKALALGSGMLVCVPVPEEDALPDDLVREVVSQAVAEAAHTGLAGPELTPWLLARVAALTEGASVRANTALIVNDARVAGQLALELTRTPAD
jgi:pseudouridine-5'-phosphate glycosidase